MNKTPTGKPRLKVGCKVKASLDEDGGRGPRRGTYLGKCEHGFCLVGFGPNFSGHSGHNSVFVPTKFDKHCAWYKRNQLEVIA